MLVKTPIAGTSIHVIIRLKRLCSCERASEGVLSTTGGQRRAGQGGVKKGRALAVATCSSSAATRAVQLSMRAFRSATRSRYSASFVA
jgi:hypothetical protein